MARTKIDSIILDITTPATPKVPASATVTVKLRGSSTNATLYSDAAGTPLPGGNPVTVTNGRIEVWVDEGQYDLVISGATFATYTQQWEGASGATTKDGGITTLKIADAAVTFAKLGAGLVGTGASTIAAGNDARFTKVFQTLHTFAIAGAVRVQNAEVDYIPPFRFHKGAGQTSVAAKVSYRLNNASANTVTFDIRKNGVAMTGFAGLVANNTAWQIADPADIALADGDDLALVVNSIVGSPQNLSVTLILEHTLS